MLDLGRRGGRHDVPPAATGRQPRRGIRPPSAAARPAGGRRCGGPMRDGRALVRPPITQEEKEIKK